MVEQERRVAMLDTLLSSGLAAEDVEDVYRRFVRGYVHTEEHGASYVTLAAQESWADNVHKCHFGWTRFRKEDIAFIKTNLEQNASGRPLIEIGGGSGWLSFLLRKQGLDIRFALWLSTWSSQFSVQSVIIHGFS